MKIAILGATRGIGRALARVLAVRGDTLFLLGREHADLERSAADLAVRASGSKPGFAACDLAQPGSFAPALTAAEQAMDGLDAVVVTAGVFDTQDALEQDREATIHLLTIDFTHTVAFCEEARERLLARGGGVLCVLSSVAGDRGRAPIVLYGAAKAGLSHYLEGLDHRFHKAGLRTVCIKPGFVRTGMTAGLPEAPFAADPEPVAEAIVRALDRRRSVAYVPRIWGVIMLVIRWLPRFVMRRVGF